MSKRYRLQSAPMISAPTMIRWAVDGSRFEEDRALFVHIISEGWTLPADVTEALLTGKTPYTVEGGDVVFTA